MGSRISELAAKPKCDARCGWRTHQPGMNGVAVDATYANQRKSRGSHSQFLAIRNLTPLDTRTHTGRVLPYIRVMATVAAVAIGPVGVRNAVQAPTLAQKATNPHSSALSISASASWLAAAPHLCMRCQTCSHRSWLLTTSRQHARAPVTNTTCLCPKSGVDGQGLLDEDLVAVQAFRRTGGRPCAGGCSGACSRKPWHRSHRVQGEALVGGIEAHTPGLAHEEFTLDLELCATADVATTLTFLRLIGCARWSRRVRRGARVIFIESAFTSRSRRTRRECVRQAPRGRVIRRSFRYSGVLRRGAPATASGAATLPSRTLPPRAARERTGRRHGAATR